MGEDWSHRDLQYDLLRTRQSNGEVAVAELSLASWGSAGWADVAAAKPSWTNFNATCYEIKVSRGDFLSDVQSGKYRRYLPFFHRFYFAAPAGMLKRAEVPDGCGLIVRGDNGWSGVCAPSVMAVEDGHLTQLLMALVFRQANAPWRTPDNPEHKIRLIEAYKEHQNTRKWIAADAREMLEDARRAEQKMERARGRLAEAMGEEANGRGIGDLVEELIRREATDDEMKRAVRNLIEGWGCTVPRIREALEKEAGRLERVEEALTALARPPQPEDGE